MGGRSLQDQVLVSSGRRCCLCFGLNGDFEPKRGQLAHLDHDHSHNTFDNLAFLCFEHHDEYDSQTSQSKGWTLGEVKNYRNMLYEAVAARRAAASTALAEYDSRPSPIIGPLLSLTSKTLNAVDTTTGQVFRSIPAYSLLYGCDFTFPVTNPGKLDIAVKRLFVDVVKFTDVDMLGVWEGALGGGMRVREYSCTINAVPGSYECQQLDEDYDYIRLSSGEMEMFRVNTDVLKQGLYHLQVGLEYAIADQIKRIESHDQIQTIGIFDPVAYPEIEDISAQIPESIMGNTSWSIHVEVFVAAHLLAKYRVPFTPRELRCEITRRFGDTRPGIQTHISAHCVANAPKNATVVYNYLWRLPDGRLRLFNLEADRPHRDRANARTEPDRSDVPIEYRSLLAHVDEGRA